MRIFHVATLADWQRAKASGSYTTSTYGATLDEVGYLHAARREQVPGVLTQFYTDVSEPILVLEIDTDLLDVPWHQDQVGGDTYPHIYGPLSPRAVVGYHAPSRTSFEHAVTEGPARAPAPPLTLAFQALACMLLVACVVFGVAAIWEQHRNTVLLTHSSAPAVLWPLAIASGSCAVVGFFFAASFRPRRDALLRPGGARA